MKPTTDGLSRAIDNFLAMAAVEQGLAANTIEAYSRDLRTFSEFLCSRGVVEWASVDLPTIRNFVASLRGRGLSPRSIARHMVTIRRLMYFLENEGSAGAIRLPRLSLQPPARKLPHTLSADDVCRLLSQPDASTALGARDQAM